MITSGRLDTLTARILCVTNEYLNDGFRTDFKYVCVSMKRISKWKIIHELSVSYSLRMLVLMLTYIIRDNN